MILLMLDIMCWIIS